MIDVHIVGASGYAAAELVRLLTGHPDVRIATLESASSPGARFCDIFPALPQIERRCEPSGTVAGRAQRDDVVFLAGNDELARMYAPVLLERGVRVVDLSNAFRLHANAGRAVFGFPERYRSAIAGASLIANPGCYVTAALLAITPLGSLADRIAHIVIDAKSGITGAGRTPAVGSLFAEVDEDVRAYGMNGHRHEREIGQEIAAAGIDRPFVFAPHVVPLRRGLLADVYLVPSSPISRDAVLASYERSYAGNPFVTIFHDERVPHLPALEKTNDAQLAVAERGGVVHIVCGIDNLGKGAAGQAVQNMNLMCGLEEERGLGTRIAVR